MTGDKRPQKGHLMEQLTKAVGLIVEWENFPAMADCPQDLIGNLFSCVGEREKECGQGFFSGCYSKSSFCHEYC